MWHVIVVGVSGWNWTLNPPEALELCMCHHKSKKMLGAYPGTIFIK